MSSRFADNLVEKLRTVFEVVWQHLDVAAVRRKTSYDLKARPVRYNALLARGYTTSYRNGGSERIENSKDSTTFLS